MSQHADRFYLPQPDQPFEGTVDTPIGTLEFSNQYPSMASLDTLLGAMDFHGATQAYLWGIPIASFANFQFYMDHVFKVRQGELVKTTNREQKLGILTANATTPYILATVNLSETGPFVVDLPAGAIVVWSLAVSALIFSWLIWPLIRRVDKPLNKRGQTPFSDTGEK
jgi:hypothetical protein